LPTSIDGIVQLKIFDACSATKTSSLVVSSYAKNRYVSGVKLEGVAVIVIVSPMLGDASETTTETEPPPAPPPV